eukprot:ctg_63.g19
MRVQWSVMTLVAVIGSVVVETGDARGRHAGSAVLPMARMGLARFSPPPEHTHHLDRHGHISALSRATSVSGGGAGISEAGSGAGDVGEAAVRGGEACGGGGQGHQTLPEIWPPRQPDETLVADICGRQKPGESAPEWRPERPVGQVAAVWRPAAQRTNCDDGSDDHRWWGTRCGAAAVDWCPAGDQHAHQSVVTVSRPATGIAHNRRAPVPVVGGARRVRGTWGRGRIGAARDKGAGE